MIVRICGWRKGFKKVSMNRLLREFSGMNLSEAKEAVDKILDGETLEIRLTCKENEGVFIKEVEDAGGIVSD